MNLLEIPPRPHARTLAFLLTFRLTSTAFRAQVSLALAALLLTGCAIPVGADRVTTRQAYKQVDADAMGTSKPSASTVSILHRYDLDRIADRHPGEAVRQLHEEAVTTGDRDLLFALAEMSYVAGEKSHDRRFSYECDTRDYYLGSAIYAWLFLFGEGKDPQPSAFDRRFRQACDFYNYGLGLALTESGRNDENVQLKNERRRLPVGEIELRLSQTNITPRMAEFEQLLLTDQFRVRGLSARNREAGVGVPLICVGHWNTNLSVFRTSPATALLRGPRSLEELISGTNACVLDVYSSLDTDTFKIGNTQLPLETDLTTYRAYMLNQSFIWNMGYVQFLAPNKRVSSQLALSQPYIPGRVPLVFVHGTFSSPSTWAEMANSLIADPQLRRDYQLWTFVYSTGNPLPVSVTEFRDTLTDMVNKLDPEGKDPALHQMVIVGHSQGGLLAHYAAIDTGDRLWRVLNTNRLENLKLSEAQRAEVQHLFFYKPLPFVKRVVFISTPHHGSYKIGGFARRWARRLISMPGHVVSRGRATLKMVVSPDASKFLRGRIPTSLDAMSPKNPAIQALADIPVAPGVKAHSIISVKGNRDYHQGSDGLVSYKSAHVDYVESEYIVRGPHTCLDLPATIQEVRRILHEHLDQLPPGTIKPASPPASGVRTDSLSTEPNVPGNR